MPYYRRRPANDVSAQLHDVDPSGLQSRAAGLTRRLLPFPGVDAFSEHDVDSAAESMEQGLKRDVLAPLPSITGVESIQELARTSAKQLPLTAMQAPLSGVAPSSPFPNDTVAAADSVSEAAALLPRAAGILDEEMARGVLAARSAPRTTPSAPLPVAWHAPVSSGLPTVQSTLTDIFSGSPVPAAMMPSAPDVLPEMSPLLGMNRSEDFMKNLYSFVDRFAALMPKSAGGGTAGSAHQGSTPWLNSAPVSPGQAATFAMALHNEERHAVMLRPVATALINEEGEQLPARCVECSQREIALAPGQQHRLQVQVTVPLNSAPGRYAGLLVIAGTAQLQALLCVEVQADAAAPARQ